MSWFEPTGDQRRTVKALSGFGVPQDGIATHIGIDAKTLRKHFRDELDRGSVEATATVAQSLFRMATEGNNVAAAIFWMKVRAGWREKHEVTVTRPLQALSDAELEGIIEHYRELDDDEADRTGQAAPCLTPPTGWSPPTNDR